MSNLQTLISAFIAEHELDESINDALANLVKAGFHQMSSEWLSASTKAAKVKTVSEKPVKVAQIASVSDAESLEELKSVACTTATLTEYCRDNSLRVTGTKKELAERAWRHLQGENSDEDSSPRSKPKKIPAKKEIHSCFACNLKGQPCGIAATEQFDGEWFCFRHHETAAEIMERKNPPVVVEVPEKKIIEVQAKVESGVSKRPTAKSVKKITVSDE